MKIILIHPHDVLSTMEPWTIRITSLAKRLAERGHEVVLTYFSLDGLELTEHLIDNVKYLPMSRKLSLKNIFCNTKKILSLSGKADIIYLQKCFHFAAIPAITAAFIKNKWFHYDWDDDETAIFFHGGKPSSYISGATLALFEKVIPLIADSISYSSEKLRKKLKQQENLIHFPVGADLPPASNENVELIKERYNLSFPTFIYTGQLHGGQYIEDLIKSALKLKDRGTSFKFLVLGEGHDRARLENLTRSHNLTDSIIFTGAVARSQLSAYLKAADIAVACFRDNTITKGKSPLKIAEYLNAGKAIIASKVGEVPGMLNDAGILVTPDSTDELAIAMETLSKNKQKIKEMEIKAIKQAKKLTWSNSMQNLVDFLEKQGYSSSITKSK